jgi:hypothetical protein
MKVHLGRQQRFGTIQEFLSTGHLFFERLQLGNPQGQIADALLGLLDFGARFRCRLASGKIDDKQKPDHQRGQTDDCQ